MNAIKLLEAQHKETLATLEELVDSSAGPQRTVMFGELKSSLLAHMAIEEDLFYPAIADAQPEGFPVAEGYEEHSTARVAIDRCQRALADDELFRVRVTVLQELVKHHIKEERASILPLAKKAMSKEELERYGEEMALRFEEAKKSNPTERLDGISTRREMQALHVM